MNTKFNIDPYGVLLPDEYTEPWEDEERMGGRIEDLIDFEEREENELYRIRK